MTSRQTVEAGEDLSRDEYTNLRRCSLEGCLNFGYYDPLTDKRERCCGRSHERVLTEWEGRPEGVERTDHLKCLLVTCERDKCYPHAFCGKRHATRYTAQLAANLDQAPGGLKGGPFLWPDVHTGMPSPPASPPHGESDDMTESPITLVVHGPAGCYAWVEGEPLVSRSVEVVVSPEMRMQELVDTVMAVFFGDELRNEEGYPRWEIRLMSGYAVAPGSEFIRIFPQEGMDGTYVLQPWSMEWKVRETCVGHRSVLTLVRLAPPAVTEHTLGAPPARRQRGPVGGADGGRRNGDHILVGMKVRKLTRDVRVRARRRYSPEEGDGGSGRGGEGVQPPSAGGREGNRRIRGDDADVEGIEARRLVDGERNRGSYLRGSG